MYVGGFVLAVKTDRKADYLKMATEASHLFLNAGATRVVECWGVDVPEGEVTSFPMSVKCEPDETVLFSWIEFPDKAAYDACMAKLDAEGAMEMTDETRAVMDPRRMIFGGFEAILDT